MNIRLELNEKYEEITVSIKAAELNDEVTEIMGKLKNQKSKNIIGKKNEKMYILKPMDIILFYTKDQKIIANTFNEEYEIKEKLYEIEEVLKNDYFIRISKFAIVNVNKIKNIELFFNGSLVVNLINGKQEIISRRYISKVKEFIGMGGK